MSKNLDNLEAMLDEIMARVPHAINDGDKEYILSGVRTAKHHLYQAMKEMLDLEARRGKRHCLVCDREMRKNIDEDADYCRECVAEGH